MRNRAPRSTGETSAWAAVFLTGGVALFEGISVYPLMIGTRCRPRPDRA